MERLVVVALERHEQLDRGTGLVLVMDWTATGPLSPQHPGGEGKGRERSGKRT
jgi:hypothetical protein